MQCKSRIATGTALQLLQHNKKNSDSTKQTVNADCATTCDRARACTRSPPCARFDLATLIDCFPIEKVLAAQA
jgi:hypothetical protein